MSNHASVIQRIDLKLGFICNNYCFHCAQGNRREVLGNKSLKKIKKELEIGSKICKEVVFTGGEPTIHKNFLELISYAKKLGFKNIQIQSNGRLFAYLDFCRLTIKRGANNFALALIGHVADIHDRVTSVNGSFGQTIQGIKNLKILKMTVATNTVINKINYRYLPEIAKLLVLLGVDQFQFAFPHPIGRAKDNFHEVIPRIKKVMPFVKKGLDIGIKAGIKVMTEAIPYCLMSGYEDYIAERLIPNSKVFDAGYEIDNHEEYRKNKAKLKGPQCNLCEFYPLCEGPWREYPEYFGWEEFVPVRHR
ncbi:MAG: radical SAM protein [Candidatus Omnitrophica bacterium]|nr:radical SAM protein [Candidatus Omnitrophota bacterium]